MKKKILIIGAIILSIIVVVTLVVTLTLMGVNMIRDRGYINYDDGIVEELSDDVTDETIDEKIESSEKNEGVTYTKDFGSYKIMNGWSENDEHSSSSKFFYVKDGTGNETKPNNISVNFGKNRYSLEEHSQFKDAILRQLSVQIAGSKNVTLNANGSNTDNGYLVYTFIIRDELSNSITTQYYIVGDYKFILVHETTYGVPEETNMVAKNIVNSFKWKE